LTGAYNTSVIRPTHFEKALDADLSAKALNIDPEDMLCDPAATGAYRANLTKVPARRSVACQGEVLTYKRPAATPIRRRPS
jgi:hypothetical protein